MKTKKIFGILTIFFLICISTLTITLAQTRSPGVTVGDSFKYSFTLDLNTSNSETSLPSLFDSLMEQARSIEWVQVNITDVSGTLVTSQVVMQFKNGTQQTSTEVTDVAGMTQNGPTPYLIASNLNANDQIYPGSDQIINETVTRNSREENHQSTITEYNVTQEELAAFGITGPLQQTNSADTYWDKQTGALTEMSYHMVTRSVQVNADISVEVNLIESNVLAAPTLLSVSSTPIPEFPITIVTILTVFASSAFIIKTRRK